jgi:hypothetical protein
MSNKTDRSDTLLLEAWVSNARDNEQRHFTMSKVGVASGEM